MARSRRQAPSTNASLTAAATRIPLWDTKAAKAVGAKPQEWQGEAWAYFDEVPEIKESVRYRGNQLGKVRLFVATDNPDDPDGDPIPVSDPASGVPPAVAAAADAELARLRSLVGGQGEILRMLDMNLEVAGEAYLVGMGPRTEEVRQRDGTTQLVERPEDWTIRSVSEVENINGTYKVKATAMDAKPVVLDPERDTCIRIWTRHPQWADNPDSAMRGLLGECRALQVLTQQVLAHANRSLSAGFFTVPNELSFGPSSPTTNEDGTTTEADDPLDAVMHAVLVAPIADPASAASVQPGLLRGPAEYLKADYLRRITFYDAELVAGIEARIEARIARIARGLNLPVEKIMGHQQCVTTDTEAMTAEGWCSHADLRPGDLLLTLNHVTGLAEWQPAEAVSVFDTTDQPLVSLEGKSHSSLSTLNHRWPVVTQRGARRWYESADLNTNCRLVPAAPSADQPAEPKWSDAMAEVVAWYYTEGSDCAGGGALIYQSERANPAKVAMIRRALTELAGPAPTTAYRHSKDGRPAWTETVVNGCVRFRLNKPLATLVRACAPGKVPTYEFLRSLTVAQVELFVQRSVDGDGYRHPSGGFQFHQSDPRRADAFEFACLLTGRAVSRRTIEGAGGFKQSTRHLVIARRAATQRVGFGVQATVVRHTGQVWCPTVANGTWLARRNGSVYFTGNTTFANAAQVDEDEYNDYLAPSVDTATDALSWAFLWPQLEEHPDVPPEWVSPLFVAADPSALIAEPNTEANADAAWDRNTISDASYRKAKGFGDDDAPEALELLIKAGLRRGILTAELTTALLNLLTAEAGLPPIEVAEPAGDEMPTDPDPEAVARLLQQLASDPAAVEQLAAAMGYTPTPALGAGREPPPFGSRVAAADAPGNTYGRQLSDLDRELRARLLVAANDAMGRALERAANRLRSRANGTELRAGLRNVALRDTFAHLGPAHVATVLGGADTLEGAWDELAGQFVTWCTQAQSEALDVLQAVAGGRLAPDQLAALADRQATDRADAWVWMADALTTLATERMYDPDPAAPPEGEFDPTLRVPAGLVRQAIARAGGAQGLLTAAATKPGPAWVTLTDGGTRPAGGIGTGELVRGGLRDAGASVEAYRWVYGPAFRQRPFHPHQALDGVVFTNFDDAVLANPHPWPPGAFYLPGDHGGCVCDFEPIIIPAQGAAAGPSPAVTPTEQYPGGLTAKGATEWMMERWGTDPNGKKRAILLTKLGPSAANDMAATMHELMTAYPQTALRVRVFGSSSEVTAAAKQTYPRFRFPAMGRAYADAQRDTGWIRLNQTKAKAVADTQAMLERDVATGFHPPGTASIKSVVRHEFGHHLKWVAEERAGAAEVSRVIREVVADEADRLGLLTQPGAGVARARYQVMRDLSRYGAKNDDEFVAEAFSEYTSNPNPRPLAKALVERLVALAEAP